MVQKGRSLRPSKISLRGVRNLSWQPERCLECGIRRKTLASPHPHRLSSREWLLSFFLMPQDACRGGTRLYETGSAMVLTSLHQTCPAILLLTPFRSSSQTHGFIFKLTLIASYKLFIILDPENFTSLAVDW